MKSQQNQMKNMMIWQCWTCIMVTGPKTIWSTWKRLDLFLGGKRVLGQLIGIARTWTFSCALKVSHPSHSALIHLFWRRKKGIYELLVLWKWKNVPLVFQPCESIVRLLTVPFYLELLRGSSQEFCIVLVFSFLISWWSLLLELASVYPPVLKMYVQSGVRCDWLASVCSGLYYIKYKHPTNLINVEGNYDCSCHTNSIVLNKKAVICKQSYLWQPLIFIGTVVWCLRATGCGLSPTWSRGMCFS